MGDTRVLKFIIPGRTIVKKNSQKVKTVFKYGYATKRKVDSVQYVMWKALAQPYLEFAKKKLGRCYDVPLNASLKFYFKNHRSEADLSALYEGIQDEMKTYGIIADDRLIYSHNGSEKVFDPKEKERLEVELVPLDEWKKKNQIKATISN